MFWEGHKNLKKISHFILTLLSNFKTRCDIFFNYVAFSHYLNFCILYLLYQEFLHWTLQSSTIWAAPKFFLRVFIVKNEEYACLQLHKFTLQNLENSLDQRYELLRFDSDKKKPLDCFLTLNLVMLRSMKILFFGFLWKKNNLSKDFLDKLGTQWGQRLHEFELELGIFF